MGRLHHRISESPTGSSSELSALNSQLALPEQGAGLETSCGPFQLQLPHGHMVILCFMFMTSKSMASGYFARTLHDGFKSFRCSVFLGMMAVLSQVTSRKPSYLVPNQCS